MRTQVLAILALIGFVSQTYAQTAPAPSRAAPSPWTTTQLPTPETKAEAQKKIAELLANPPAGFPRPGTPAFRHENLLPFQVGAIAGAHQMWAEGKMQKWPEMPASIQRPKGLNVLSPNRMQRVTEALKRGPAPRTRDGKPDLSGNWWSYSGSNATPFAEEGLAALVPIGYESNFPSNTPKYKPELVRKTQDLFWGMMKTDNTVKCGYPGFPRIGAPSHILQTEKELVFLYNDQSGFAWRVVRMNGKFQEDIDSTYYGDSVGHWEGDTLVVESRNFNTETWMGEFGYFHSPQMRTIEKLHRVGDVTFQQVTVIDPEVLVEPWVREPHLMVRTEEQIWEPTLCTPALSDEHHADESIHATRW